ncbi:MAG: hypothetical protein JW861_11550 [Bacteroidales bacterium]|nr:hypothetical protein [Bacteroidales bacterium]
MKKAAKILITAAFLSAAPLLLLAQTPPHPNGGNAPGPGNTPVGGGAPLDGGLTVMLILGAAYGTRKVFQLKK